MATARFCNFLFLLLAFVFISSFFIFKRAYYGPFRYIYIDLGANDGSSIMSFVGNVGEKVNPAVDGSELAPGLSDLTGIMNAKKSANSVPSVGQDRTNHTAIWDVIVFEANSRFTGKLEADRAELLEAGKVKSYHLYNGTAISVKDGFIDFILDNNQNGSFGSTLQADSLSAVGRRISTPMVDILTLFKTHKIRHQDYVVVKVDVEGHEYDLVRRMISTGLLHNFIDKLAVEWHHNAWMVYGHPGNATLHPKAFRRHEVYRRRYEKIMKLLEKMNLQKKLFNWA